MSKIKKCNASLWNIFADSIHLASTLKELLDGDKIRYLLKWSE